MPWDKRIQWCAEWVPFIPYNNEAVFIKIIKKKTGNVQILVVLENCTSNWS